LNPTKILFIGLGGAGQRHLRIFRELLPNDTDFSAYRKTSKTPLLNADFTVNAETTLDSFYGLRIFDKVEAAFENEPALTVISNPTSFHRKSMMMALNVNSNIFVEKPWAENLEGFVKFKDLVLAKKIKFHISFQRRYHSQIKDAFNAFNSGVIGRPIAATFTVFSNVPSWHPYEDWRSLYAVRSELGGGVLLTEIHEIDLVNWFFGIPNAVFCSGGNYSHEKLSVEDTVNLTLLYNNFSVQLILCFMHKSPSRRIHIAGTSGEILWEDKTGILKISPFDGNEVVKSAQLITNDDMFMAQANNFLFDWSEKNTLESLKAAANSLSVVESAKRSMKTGKAELVKNYF